MTPRSLTATSVRAGSPPEGQYRCPPARHPQPRAARRGPLTGTEIAVIRQIHRAPRATPSQIAEATGLRRSNVSTAIRALEAGGLVVRDQHAGNARSVALVPTALASESVARINAYWAALLQDVPGELLAEGILQRRQCSQTSPRRSSVGRAPEHHRAV